MMLSSHSVLPYSKIFLDQADDLILSQFQEEDHPFIKKALGDDNIHLVALYYVYKPKTDTPRPKNTDDDETLINLVQNMEVNSLVFIDI